VSGSSLGGVIWPIALKSLLYKVGFAWGVRIAAFIMLPLLGAACLSIRLPIHKGSSSKTKPKPDLSIVKHPVLILLAVGLFFIYLGLFSPFFYITSWTLSLDLNANMAFYSPYSLLFFLWYASQAPREFSKFYKSSTPLNMIHWSFIT
jgi:hypothetical protein